MKTIPVVLAAMMVLTNTWAAKDVDLTEFDGKYKGNGTATSAGMTYPLTANVKFAVAKNGSTAKVTMSGIVSAGASVPWGTTLKLKKKGKMTTSSVVGISSGGIYPASGKYKLPRSSKLEATARTTVVTNTAEQDVTIEVKPKGRKKQLKVKITVSIDGAEAITYNVTATGK